MKHEIHVKHIFQKLQEADLQVNIIKYEFHMIEVVYLNLIIIILLRLLRYNVPGC